ncbi:MAG: universal stress protein [Gammaproteobacteria bacterium]|nr:universal stress protein [Gammaproteobacteria bacterium]MDP2141788.1 universal stress protein [Gammaproteobacteria bacterium]MDP2348010.1 universal stress protein [Gammaproteobacteria bacterium]
MKTIKKLLVVLDPDTDSDFIVQRARLFAEKYQASVLLFMCKPNALSPDSVNSSGLGGLFFKKQQKLFVEHYEKLLQVLRGEFAASKIKVTAEFSAARNGSDTILKKILDYKPDLTIKSIQEHSTLKNILITSTDWHLIKLSPYPLLLVKPREWEEGGSIIAAVDPMHVKAQQNQLDHLLLETTVQMSAALNLVPMAFHSYLPDLGALFPKVLDAEDYIKEVRAKHRTKVEELASSHGIGLEHIILARGDLVRSLTQSIKKNKANVLAIGALSRNMVERAIVGSTAEKILHDTPCDVLVMKNTAESMS